MFAYMDIFPLLLYLYLRDDFSFLMEIWIIDS